MPRWCAVAVKVRLNRASLTLQQNLVRQIDGKVKNRRALIRAFERSGVVEEWKATVAAKLIRLHQVLVGVFSGGVTGVGLEVSSVYGFDLARPWAPLSERYAERKITDSFWHETGTLLDYVARSMQMLSGPQAVRKVEVKAAPIPRGAKSLKVSTLITPARLPEPLQSLVMYPFLQGRGNDLSAMGGTDVQAVKLLVNHALRGFIPDIAGELGRQMLDELRT